MDQRPDPGEDHHCHKQIARHPMSGEPPNEVVFVDRGHAHECFGAEIA
jgi:hypothetical protein